FVAPLLLPPPPRLPSTFLRYLHSFPTRRSSDLADYPIFPSGGISVCLRVIRRVGNRPVLGHICQFLRVVRHRFGEFSDDLCHTADRKSTRLNSSHVSISYAVFCLKKKNPQRRHS